MPRRGLVTIGAQEIIRFSLLDCAIQIIPLASDLDIRSIHSPTAAGQLSCGGQSPFPEPATTDDPVVPGRMATAEDVIGHPRNLVARRNRRTGRI